MDGAQQVVFIAQFIFLLCFQLLASQCLSPQKQNYIFGVESKMNLINNLHMESHHGGLLMPHTKRAQLYDNVLTDQLMWN